MNIEDLGLLVQIGSTCGVPILLLLLGLVVGRTIERAHLSRLKQTEDRLFTIPLTCVKVAPPGIDASGATLVMGSVVVASDYLKTFLAGLRNLIGGEVRSFERLMERARREAVCRAMQEAHEHGAIAVVNLRLETSNIGRTRSKSKKKIMPMVEVIAYGTALLPAGHGAGALDVSLPCPGCGYALIGMKELGCPECGWNRGGASRSPSTAPPTEPAG